MLTKLRNLIKRIIGAFEEPPTTYDLGWPAYQCKPTWIWALRRAWGTERFGYGRKKRKPEEKQSSNTESRKQLMPARVEIHKPHRVGIKEKQ